MNKIARNKKSLIIGSIVIMLLSLLLVGGAVALVVYGANVVGEKLLVGLILIIVGSLLAILFAGGIVFGAISFFTGKSLVALNGSVDEENLAKGTANMIKCQNCGESVNPEDRFCWKCGATTTEFKQCENCKILNKKDANVCTACGEKLK